MTITPRWNQENSPNQPNGLPSGGSPPHLSDLDQTQPSLRVQGVKGAQPSPQSASELAPRPYATTPGDVENFGATVGATQNLKPNEDSLVGTIFAERYEIVELLGRGGMGSVYKARNNINKNFRALKLMHAHLVADPQVFRRFQQEATAAARINHPNAITIIDMGMAADGRPYLIMDFLDGMSLSELLKYKGKLPIRQALHIFLQMCGALAEAHSHGVIHRDIKPSNVMLLDSNSDDEFVVKVVDFGIAKVFPQEGDPTMKDTTTGELFGSPPYMSPEQCLGKRLDYRSDIYSMGCLMYEVLTGAPPLVGQNALGTMYRQINDMPNPLSDIKDDVRLIERLDEIITKTLQKLPEQRYQTILDLHQALESAGALSAKKSRAISALTLKFQGVKRSLMNMMGSSKKAVLIAIICCGLFLASGALIVAPYLLTKDPTGIERVIAWQANKPADSNASSTGLQIHAQEMEYRHGVNSEENLAAVSKWANFYFDNDKFENAFVKFSSACGIGQELMREKFSKCKDVDVAIRTFAVDQLRRFLSCRQLSASAVKETLLDSKSVSVGNRGVNREGDAQPDSPFGLAKSTLDYLHDAQSPSGASEVYLNAVMGLVYARKNAQHDTSAKTLADQKFQSVLEAWQKASMGSESSEIFAGVLSEIGDFYLNLNEPLMLAKAEKAFSLAQGEWKNLGAKGLNNYAVAEERLGRVKQLQGDYGAAAKYFSGASESFAAAAKSDTLDKAKALFDEADARWSACDFMNSIKVHKEAARIWSVTRNNSH